MVEVFWGEIFFLKIYFENILMCMLFGVVNFRVYWFVYKERVAWMRNRGLGGIVLDRNSVCRDRVVEVGFVGGFEMLFVFC